MHPVTIDAFLDEFEKISGTFGLTQAGKNMLSSKNPIIKMPGAAVPKPKVPANLRGATSANVVRQ